MQNLRNRFEHAEFQANKHEIWRTLFEFLNIVDRFLDEELGIELEKGIKKKKLQNKIKKIGRVWNRVEKAWIQEALTELSAKRDELQSNVDEFIEDLENEWHPHSDSIDVAYCSQCEEEGLIMSGEYTGICYKCGSTFITADCARCGDIMPGYPWDPDYCSSCKDYIAAQ
jgi:hypothetical protein